MKKYIITGGSGFVGINTLLELIEDDTYNNNRYVVIDKDTTKLKEVLEVLDINAENITVIEEDLTNFTTEDYSEIFEDHCTVVHLASTVGVDKVIDYPESMIQDIKLNLTLVEALNETDLNINFVFASTSEIYGTTKVKQEDSKLTMNSPENNPRGTYASQKLTCENLYLNCTKSNVNVKVIRLFSAVGRYQEDTFVVPKFIKLAQNNQTIIVNGDGSQSRNFTDVRLFSSILLSDNFWTSDQSIFNMGSIRNHYSIHQLAHMIIDKLGSSSEVEYADGPIGEQLRIPQLRRLSSLSDTPLKYIDTSLNELIELITSTPTK